MTTMMISPANTPTIVAAGRIRSTILVSLLLWTTTNNPSVHCSNIFEYAVQVDPVIFLIEPQSQLIAVDTAAYDGMDYDSLPTLMLSCQARIAPLVSKQPLPDIHWLKDGVPLVAEGNSTVITTNSTTGYSELLIQVINTSVSGFYQCEANDADGKYITHSRKAFVNVISEDQLSVDMSVEFGQPVLLDCSPVSGYNAIWRHNGIEVNESVSLTGSLLITNVTYDHQGIWQCYNIYNLTVLPSSDLEGVETLAFVFTNVSSISIGEPIELACAVTGLSYEFIHLTISWHHSTSNDSNNYSAQHQPPLMTQSLDVIENGSERITAYLMVHYTISAFEDSDVGQYFCTVTLTSPENETVSMTSQGLDLVFNDMPKVESTTDLETDEYIEYDASVLELFCKVTCDLPYEIYWTKNGRVLDTQEAYNRETGILTLSKEAMEDNSLIGLYQCFAENKHGSDYSVNRILVKYLSNPPGNVVITPLTNTSNLFLPYLNISWTPPIQRGGVDELSYSVTVFKLDDQFSSIQHNTPPSTTTDSTVVELSSDDEYIVIISVYRPIKGISIACSVNSAARFFSVSKSFDYLECTDDGDVHVKWTPLGTNPEIHPAKFVTIKGVCLHSGDIFQYETVKFDLRSDFKERPFTELPPGTVCEFHGQYRYSSGMLIPGICANEELDYTSLLLKYYQIPSKTCQVQDTAFMYSNEHGVDDSVNSNNSILSATLSLICNANDLQLNWAIPEEMACDMNKTMSSDDNSLSLNLFGVCVNGEMVFEFNKTIDLMQIPMGTISFGSIPIDSICTFGKNNTDNNDYEFVISPGQCIVADSETTTFSSGHQENSYFSMNCSKYNDVAIVSSSSNQASYSGSRYLELSSFIVKDTNALDETTVVPALLQQANTLTTIVIVSVVCVTFIVVVAALLTVVICSLVMRYKRSVMKTWNVNEFETAQKLSIEGDTCSVKTEVDSPLYPFQNNDELKIIDLKVYEGYTIEDGPRPDTTGSSGYGSGYGGSEITTGCMDYQSRKLQEIENLSNAVDDKLCIETSLSNALTDTIIDGQSLVSLNGGPIMCIGCSRIYKRASSVDTLKNLCPCLKGEGYIKLVGCDGDMNTTDCSTKIDWSNSPSIRLSTSSA